MRDRPILGLFKRFTGAEPKAETTARRPELSRTVIDAIDHATVMVRSLDDDDGQPRVIIQMGTGGAFHWDDESAERFLTRRFPEMSAAERRLATNRLAILVTAQLRRKTASGDARKPWINRY